MPINPKNPLNVNDKLNTKSNIKENGYAKDNIDVSVKNNYNYNIEDKGNDFVNSLILNDNFDEEEEYKFYEEANASSYMEKLRLQEEENRVRSYLEELEDM